MTERIRPLLVKNHRAYPRTRFSIHEQKKDYGSGGSSVSNLLRSTPRQVVTVSELDGQSNRMTPSLTNDARRLLAIPRSKAHASEPEMANHLLLVGEPIMVARTVKESAPHICSWVQSIRCSITSPDR